MVLSRQWASFTEPDTAFMKILSSVPLSACKFTHEKTKEYKPRLDQLQIIELDRAFMISSLDRHRSFHAPSGLRT